MEHVVEGNPDGSRGPVRRSGGGGRPLCPDHCPGTGGRVRGPDSYGPSYSLVRGRGSGRRNSWKSDQHLSVSAALRRGGSRHLRNLCRRLCRGLGHGTDRDYQYYSDFCEAAGFPQRAGTADCEHGSGTDGRGSYFLLFWFFGPAYQSVLCTQTHGSWTPGKEKRKKG